MVLVEEARAYSGGISHEEAVNAACVEDCMGFGEQRQLEKLGQNTTYGWQKLQGPWVLNGPTRNVPHRLVLVLSCSAPNCHAQYVPFLSLSVSGSLFSKVPVLNELALAFCRFRTRVGLAGDKAWIACHCD